MTFSGRRRGVFALPVDRRGGACYTVDMIGKGRRLRPTEGNKMLAKHEVWKYQGAERVWVGKYKNSHNLPHWHYDCELLYVEEGEIDVFCEKKNYRLTRGDALFVASGQVHYMHARPDTVLEVFVFDYNIIKPFSDGLIPVSPKLEGDYDLPGRYERLRRILTGKQPFCDAEAECEIARLVIDVFRGEELTKRPEAGTTVQAFKRLLGEIAEKYEFYTFEDAAGFMGMSPAYFSRFFHNAAGMTFSQYLNYVRVENAVHLLRSDKNLQMTEIAIRCGFSTIRNFNRTFKELTGFSPRRLPEGYTLDDKFSYSGAEGESCDPTLTDCELIEKA